MSVRTELQIRSLARDPSGQLANQVGALRRAENVVLRAPGVAESRPNFDLYLERMAATTLRVKALREYGGSPVALEYDTSGLTWGLRDLATNTVYTAPSDTGKPIDYDSTEACWAEARKSLYFSTYRGIWRIETAGNTTNGLDCAGVEMLSASDWLTANRNFGDQAYSWAYALVFVRKDANGYIRRSPPSERWAVTSAFNVRPGLATRIYFSDRLRAGDLVELYRTRGATGDAPSPEMFLTYVHTLTSAEIALTYFVPPYDERDDDELGVTLYTAPSQGGALAAKYPPPRAQVLAPYASCMWYARATQKARVALTLRSVGLGGPVRGAVSAGISGGGLLATFTLGSPVVVINTPGLIEGADFTDNVVFGSTIAGTCVPALTTIFSVDSPTQITMSANALAGGSTIAGMMSRYAPSGIATAVDAPGGTHVLGLDTVTGMGNTANLRVGMGWTDSASGPATAGALTAADTRIAEIVSSSSIRLTKVAIGSGSGGAGYDCVEVATVPFYAWPGNAILTASTPVWSWPLRCAPYWSSAFGLQSMASFVTSLALAVNYYAVQSGSTFRVRAFPLGDTNLDDKEVTNWSKSLVFEEVDGTGSGMVNFLTGATFTTPFTVVPSRTTAFDPVAATHTASIDDKPNRLYWSEPDEPESVPLVNYVDIGAEQYPIFALAPLTDALIVFTKRGVYRVTGSAPNAWAVECLDDELRLMRPECVAVVADTAYAWMDRGFFAIDRNGCRSISAGALDVELHALTQHLYNSAAHGSWVAAWPARNFVLFGVPGVITATKTVRIFCYSLITSAWSEWPLDWGVVAESKEDGFYYSKPPSSIVLYEVRSAREAINGYDRIFTLASIVSFSSVTLTVAVSVAGQWEPAVGDMVAAVTAGCRYYRRITAVNTVAANYVVTLEAAIAGSLTTWKAYETAETRIILEWHPASPAGIPVGALCRELQVQFDMREGPDSEKDSSIPEYVIGGKSERDLTPYTVTSNRARVNQIQPIRVGCSRQIARSANVAAYLSTGDIYCMRVNGLSLVWEGTSERTRR